MTDQYQINAEQLRSFIERYERLEAEKQDIADQQKEVLAEAKSCGYDTAWVMRQINKLLKIADQQKEVLAEAKGWRTTSPMREIIELRKMDPDERAEKEAILQVYLKALGLI
jgi:uncharacterized protein (UPF0335 family)